MDGEVMAKSRMLHAFSLQTAPSRTAANKAALSTDLLWTVTDKLLRVDS